MAFTSTDLSNIEAAIVKLASGQRMVEISIVCKTKKIWGYAKRVQSEGYGPSAESVTSAGSDRCSLQIYLDIHPSSSYSSHVSIVAPGL